MRSRFLICALALIAVPSLSVLSQDSSMSNSGLYFDVGGGLSLFSEIGKVKEAGWFEKDGDTFYLENPPDVTSRKDGTPDLKENDLDAGFDLGWAVGGAVGYRFGAIRVEGEGAYFAANLNMRDGNDIDKDNYDTQPGISVLALMANGWFDVDTGTIVTPFLGVGVGGIHGTANRDGVRKNAPDDFEETKHSGWGFAFQGGAGAGIEVTDGLSVHLGYRLFGTLETTYTHEVDAEDVEDPLLAAAARTAGADKIVTAVAFPLLVHRVELGVRYQF
jgi:opacity protein-like surface antigen